MTPRQQKQQIALLALAQAFLLINGVTMIALSGLVGLALAEERRWATLPVTCTVVGTALTTLPAAFFMKHHGRRAGFILGALLGIVAALLCALAVYQHSFWLLCLGTLVAGSYAAIGQQYRFAAADVADVSWRPRAISLTLAGGILGGILGPEIAKHSRDLLAPPFLASYLALALIGLGALFTASRLQVPGLSVQQQRASGRPLRALMTQPAYLAALCAAACGYGVMNLLMTATPLAMDLCAHPFPAVAFILEWHVIGMFGPSFVTGTLIRRCSLPAVLLTGAGLMAACIAVAITGVSLMHFWWALTLLGVGWNFLFIGGTALLTESCHPEERAKAQGANDFVVFTVQGVTSLASGAMISASGWYSLNLLAIPLVLLTAATTVWWWRRYSA
ncbi:MAG: MFS transporter [Proteobacteria bacterium]|nr:MFS transporter [Pseudomonadota bacterium]HQR04622.1 MFS transporter [Rhodocyclaceae bacterium]